MYTLTHLIKSFGRRKITAIRIRPQIMMKMYYQASRMRHIQIFHKCQSKCKITIMICSQQIIDKKHNHRHQMHRSRHHHLCHRRHRKCLCHDHLLLYRQQLLIHPQALLNPHTLLLQHLHPFPTRTTVAQRKKRSSHVRKH